MQPLTSKRRLLTLCLGLVVALQPTLGAAGAVLGLGCVGPEVGGCCCDPELELEPELESRPKQEVLACCGNEGGLESDGEQVIVDLQEDDNCGCKTAPGREEQPLEHQASGSLRLGEEHGRRALLSASIALEDLDWGPCASPDPGNAPTPPGPDTRTWTGSGVLCAVETGRALALLSVLRQ